MKKLLITGFEPFDIHESNPSGDLANTFNNSTIGNFKVCSAVLPVDYKIAPEMVIDLIEEIKQVKDISLLKALKYMLHYGLMNEGRISVEQYNRELDEANARIEAGDYISQEDLEKESSEW